MTLVEFENQLKSVLLDKNFEFFIHNLPRDERVSLVRAEQRLIQQATAQFNASGAEETAAIPPADIDAQPEAPVTAPLTTHDADNNEAAPVDEVSLTSAPAASAGSAAAHDWLDYFTLLLSLTSVLLLVHLIVNVLPGLSRRINNLSADPEPEPEPRSLASRLRPARSPGLREDRYEDDDDDDETERAQQPRRHDDD